MVRVILAFVGLISVGIVAWAAEKDSRAPATVPTSNGVVCGQGRGITEAEEKLNDKLATPGEVMTSMTRKFGKIKNAKTTGVTIHVDNSNPAATSYIVCASLSGDPT